jgi:PAS domain S-box-containing protein
MDNQPTILAVDDDPASLALLVRTLTQAGHLVRPADSGELALAAALAAPPDLVLLDIRMKGMSGLEVCRRFRAVGALSAIPIILLSAVAGSDEWAAGLRLGASDYIIKPFQTEELLSRVSTHLSLRRARSSVEQQGLLLQQANRHLQLELVVRRRAEEELRHTLDRAERSRLAVLSILEDQRQSEMRLREQTHLLSESQRVGHVGSWFWDLAGPVAWSEETYRIYGVSPDAFVPTAESMIALIHPDDRAAMQAWIAACMAQSGPAELEFRIVLPDGTIRYAMGRGGAVGGAGGRLAHIAGTVQDITERRLAEAERAQLESDFRQIQKMESVGRLAGGVAHDFNNMLAVILGRLDLAIKQVSPDAPLYADLIDIRDAAVRSAALTRQLLAFARKQTVAPRALDLNEVVTRMSKMLRSLIGENIDLKWLAHANLWPVNVDPAQIDQILTNLCLNARDAISSVGTITIETSNSALDAAFRTAHPGSVAGDHASLAVSDDGCGMDKEQLSRAFEPFFTTKAVGKGTGLGLSTVYGIVKQNGGYIDVQSEPNHGTTVRIYLPRYTGEAVVVLAAEAADDTAGALPRGGETILLVEDEPALLRLTTRMLEDQGYEVLAASTPGGAIEMARNGACRASLLITDVIMPEMNGQTLARHLLTICPRLKCLFVSGYPADVIARHGVLDEGTHLLEKPFSDAGLAAAVRRALDVESHESPWHDPALADTRTGSTGQRTSSPS